MKIFVLMLYVSLVLVNLAWAAAPSVESVTVLPGGAEVDDDLSIFCNATDADGGGVAYEFEVWSDGSSFTTGFDPEFWTRNDTAVSGITFFTGVQTDYAIWNVGGVATHFFIKQLNASSNYEWAGYSWNGTSWVSNSSIEAGLLERQYVEADDYYIVDMDVFNWSGQTHAITNYYYVDSIPPYPVDAFTWNGSFWLKNSSLNVSFPTGELLFNVFAYNGSLYTVTDGLSMYRWNDSQWVAESTLATGLNHSLSGQTKFNSVFELNGTLYMTTAVFMSQITGWSWNGTSWNDDEFVVSGINASSYDSSWNNFLLVGDSPVFELDGDTWKIDGPYSYKLSDWHAQNSSENVSYVGYGNLSYLQTWEASCRAFDGSSWSVWVNSSVLTVNDTLPALWSGNVTNVSSAAFNDTVVFNLSWSDQGNLSNATFGWNCSGEGWVNVSGVNLTLQSEVSSFTYVLNYSRNITECSWHVSAADLAGNYNVSSDFLLLLSKTLPVPVIQILNEPIANDEGLNVSVAFTDADNDSYVATEIVWYRNGVENASLANLSFVESGNTSDGDTWTASVRVLDLYNWSLWVNDSVVINDTTAPVIQSLYSSLTTCTTLDTVVFTGVLVDDSGNDSVLNSACVFQFQKDGYNGGNGAGNAWNLTTNTKSGGTVSLSLSMGSFSSGNLNWQAAYCSDVSSNLRTNSSVGIAVTISEPATAAPGGGGLSAEERLPECNVTLDPEKLIINADRTNYKVILYNGAGETYTPSLGFGDDSSIYEGLSLTNPVGSVLSGQSVEFGIRYDSIDAKGENYGEAVLVFRSTNCADVYLPIEVDLNANTGFIDFLLENGWDLLSLAKEPVLEDPIARSKTKFFNVGLVFVILFLGIVGLAWSSISKSFGEKSFSGYVLVATWFGFIMIADLILTIFIVTGVRVVF